MTSQATATAERTEMENQQEPTSLFISKCINQKIFVKQPYLHVQNGIPVFVPGESIQFTNHEYRTSDPKIKEFLRNHRLFGTQITEVTEGDFGRHGSQAQPAMIRGAMTTKPTTSKEQDSQTKDRFASLIESALQANPEAKVAIPCGFEDCDYIALGEDEASAKRSLNGHRTVRGHHPKA